MQTTLSPSRLTVIDLGGLSSARKSRMSTLPFSVPAYIEAPSGENDTELSGVRNDKVRSKLRRVCQNGELRVTH